MTGARKFGVKSVTLSGSIREHVFDFEEVTQRCFVFGLYCCCGLNIFLFLSIFLCTQSCRWDSSPDLWSALVDNMVE